MGCFISKSQSSYKEEKWGKLNGDKIAPSALAKSHKSQLSSKSKKWWETNDDKLTESSIAESLFCYPSEMLDCTDVETVANSTKLALLSAFQDALRDVQEQPYRAVEQRDHSTITKIMKLTGRFLRPIDVLLPKLLAHKNVSRALCKAGLDSAMVSKEFYNLHYRMEQNSSYEAVRKHCYDFLLETTRQINTSVGQENDIRDLTETLCMDRTDAAILVGELGVDKVAVVKGLAQSMLHGRVVPMLLDRSIVALDMDAIVYRDEGKGFHKIIADVWHELSTSNRKIVLFIEDINIPFHDVNTRCVLRDNISQDRVQCIGTMLRDQYDKYIYEDAELYRKCNAIFVRDSY